MKPALPEHICCVRRHQVRTENTSRTACYLMLTHTFLHRFRRKQAFLPKKFRKDLRLLRNPKNFSFLPNFLRKIIKILRKRIQAVDPVTKTANNKPSQPFAKFLRKTPKIRPYRVFKYSIKLCLFSRLVVVGLPRSSLAPMEHFASIKLSSFLLPACSSSLSRSSKLSTLTALG